MEGEKAFELPYNGGFPRFVFSFGIFLLLRFIIVFCFGFVFVSTSGCFILMSSYIPPFSDLRPNQSVYWRSVTPCYIFSLSDNITKGTIFLYHMGNIMLHLLNVAFFPRTFHVPFSRAIRPIIVCIWIQWNPDVSYLSTFYMALSYQIALLSLTYVLPRKHHSDSRYVPRS